MFGSYDVEANQNMDLARETIVAGVKQGCIMIKPHQRRVLFAVKAFRTVHKYQSSFGKCFVTTFILKPCNPLNKSSSPLIF